MCNRKVKWVKAHTFKILYTVPPKRNVALGRTSTITRGRVTRKKVGVAPILITSLRTSNHRVKTRNWSRCHAHFLASYSAARNCASASECDVVLGRYRTWPEKKLVFEPFRYRFYKIHGFLKAPSVIRIEQYAMLLV